MHILTLYTVASDYSRNHFIADKHKTVQLYKVYFIQNSPILQLYTSASDCKGVGNFPGSHLCKPCHLFLRILNNVRRITKAPSLQCSFKSRDR